MSMMFSLPAMKFIIGCFFLGVIIVTIARAEESYLEDLADEEFAGKKCPIYPPPENGALAITYIGSDALCSIQCMHGYDFESTPPALYLCVRGTWKFISLLGNTDTSLPWPNCAKVPFKYALIPLLVQRTPCRCFKAAERLFECLRDDGKLAKACEKEFRQNIPKGMKRMVS
ncbi:hypothetical protein P5673_017274 [Acropora cervicornis]|uniref:Uncharacterized protein n=1 Tax=Acropora cervicornis TaxID=6130 RepID=A0AAD9V3W5_ACRCE|nr:hypothetical protein P5673_017274 [Acropora cervicornis]